jgi:membrane protein implicated in regulation of membrane protease activity
VGSAAFLGIYSAVAAATFAWLVLAHLAAPARMLLWPVGDGLWAAANIILATAIIILALVGAALQDTKRRRYSPTPGSNGKEKRAVGRSPRSCRARHGSAGLACTR